MTLQRWDPFHDLRQMEDMVNRLWRGIGGVSTASEEWNISLDVIQSADEIIVKASIPGVKPDAINLAVENNVLTIRAE